MNEPLIVQEVPASYQVMMDSQRIRQRYKQTEVGVIPEDWDVCNLGGHVQKVGSGITPTGGERVYKNEGRPFLRSQNVGWGHLLLDDIAFIDNVTHDLFQSTEIQIDDVFLNITGASIGRSAIANGRVAGGNVNQHVCIIRTNPAQIYPRYLNYFLLSEQGQQQIDSFQAGGNRQGLNFGQIRSFRFALPSIHEQHAIATALSDVDALLAAQDQLIAKKRDIKQAAMQQLLTGKTRLPGFSGEWEVKRLGDVVTFYKGKGLPKGALSLFGTEPCIHYGELFTRYTETISEIISRTDTSGGTFRSVANDVLMPTSDVTPTGLAKASCIRADGVILGGDILVIRSDTKLIYGSFLSYLIRYEEEQILQLVTGSTVFHLYGSDMKKFTFSMPSLPEQTAIATTLSDMDTEITALEQQRDKTRALKQGMMQQLLTGKIRLIE
uniref:Type I restriction modification DNA specificity domain-containing protein n=1 Tax=mine drainage metagenome TaxID=410659 RepID=E6QTA3_9ZZZZ